MKKFYAVFGVLLISIACLCACTPKYDDIKNTYAEAGYKIYAIPLDSDIAEMSATTAGFDLSKTDKMFYAIKNEGNIPNRNRVDVVSFTDGKEATAFYNSQKENEAVTADFSVIKKGNTVIYGTKDAVNVIK